MMEYDDIDDGRYDPSTNDYDEWEKARVYEDVQAERDYEIANYDPSDRAANWDAAEEPRLTCTFADYRYDDNGEWCGSEVFESEAQDWKQGEGYCYCPDHAWEVLGMWLEREGVDILKKGESNEH